MKNIVLIILALYPAFLCAQYDINGDYTISGNMGVGTDTPEAGLAVDKNRMVLGGSAITGNYGSDQTVLEVLSTNTAYLALKGSNNSSLFISARENLGGSNIFFGGTPFSISSYNFTTSTRIIAFHTSLEGNVGIGMEGTSTHKLAVEGSIGARRVVVETTEWPDFVFEDDYELPTLSDIEDQIENEGHLKDIPSVEEVRENGIDVADMDARLLQKIEELTLYLIDQNKKIEALQKEVTSLKK